MQRDRADSSEADVFGCRQTRVDIRAQRREEEREDRERESVQTHPLPLQGLEVQGGVTRDRCIFSMAAR